MNRQKREKLYFILSLIGCCVPIIMGICFYNIMPREMPIHFNNRNIADDFASKEVALFVIPIFIIVIFLFSVFMIKKDPKRQNQSNGILYVLYVFMPIISILTSSFSISYALGYRPNISMYIIRIISVFFISIGNLLPKTKRNYTVGIKVPWTLDSDKNWNKTHRFAGFLWTIVGVLTLLFSFLFEKYMNNLFLVGAVLMIILPIIYSYILYRKESNI